MGSEPSKTICFDLDGTLCTNTFGDYEAAEPFSWAIERVNELARAGHRILIFTARGTATGIDWDVLTRAQLERWGLSYDELHFGKPSADVYVDDRALHTDSWRCSDRSSVPGFSARGVDAPGSGAEEELPVVAPPHVSCVTETGRTFAGEALEVDGHIERSRALARAVGIRSLPSREQLSAAVDAALTGPSAPDDDLVFTISLWDAGHAGFADAVERVSPPHFHVASRRLGDAALGLSRFLVPTGAGDPPAIAAATTGGDGSVWPLQLDADGSVADAMGGQLAVVCKGRVVVQESGAVRSVASDRLAELAAGLDLELSEGPISLSELESGDEALIVGYPFCILPIGSLEGRRTSGVGEVARALLAAWGRAAGLDIAGQTALLARSEDDREGVALDRG